MNIFNPRIIMYYLRSEILASEWKNVSMSLSGASIMERRKYLTRKRKGPMHTIRKLLDPLGSFKNIYNKSI